MKGAIGLTPQAAADEVSMSLSYIHQQIRDGALPSYLFGSARRIKREDLVEWFEAHKEVKAS